MSRLSSLRAVNSISNIKTRPRRLHSLVPTFTSIFAWFMRVFMSGT